MKERKNEMISLKREYGLSVADLLLLKVGLEKLGRKTDWDEKIGILASFGVEQAVWKLQDTSLRLISVERDLVKEISSNPICTEVVREQTRQADVMSKRLVVGCKERDGD